MHEASNQRLLPRAVLALTVLLLLDVGGAQVLKRIQRTDSAPVKLHGLPYDYGFRPNLDVVSAVWGHRHYRLRTNSLGFRDRAVREVPLRSDRPRLLFIGDSFTMGIGCDYEDTFVGIVDRGLAAVGREVLNAAVDGYSTTHYTRKVMHLLDAVGLRVDEVVCCIDLSDVAEDLARGSAVSPVTSTGKAPEARAAKPVRRPLPALPHTAGWRQRLRANSLLVEVLYRIKLRLAPDLPIDQRAVLWTTDERLYEEFGRQGISLQMANLAALDAKLKEHGVRLTLVVYPWIDQILRNDLDSRQVRIWREWCVAHDARFVNCFPAFVGRDPDPMKTVYECFIRGDNHFNETGHRIMAEWILKDLKNSREKAQNNDT